MEIFQQAYHVPGTLAADLGIKFKAPFDLQLQKVSAVGSNTYGAGLKIGSSADDDLYMALKTIGVSGTPVEFARSSFIDSQFPHITAGTIVVLTLDYNYNDGGAANASADVTIVLTLSKG